MGLQLFTQNEISHFQFLSIQSLMINNFLMTIERRLKLFAGHSGECP